MDENSLSKEIIGAAIEVHKAPGPGLLESIYEECLGKELSLRQIAFQRQVPVLVQYKGLSLECGYRIDLVVESLVVVELKAVETILPIHKAQLLTYLRLTDKKLGLILNFNVELMREGIHRVVNGLLSPEPKSR
jgi:GxxExxY protein